MAWGSEGGFCSFFLGLFDISLATIGVTVTGTNNAVLLMLSRALSGLGVAASWSATSALIVEIFPLEHRGKALGTIFSVTMLVSTFGPKLAGFIVERVRCHGAMLVLLLLAPVIPNHSSEKK
jgi:MFS family permease